MNAITPIVPAKRAMHAASLANLKQGGLAYWKGRIPDPKRAWRLIRVFIAEMNLRFLGFGDISKGCGCSRTTPDMWRYGRTPQIDLFDEALAVMGLELAIRERRAAHEQASDFIVGALS